MTALLHGAAKQTWQESLKADDRVLIIGASGWFGRTAAALMAGLRHPVLLISSEPREFTAGGRVLHSLAWDWDAVREFAPTLVIDCAFLTRDLISSMSLADYVARNELLTARLLEVAAEQTVSRVLTVSSGAAVYPSDALAGPLEANPYGWLKRQAEESLGALAAQRGITAIIARAWSVSGAFVLRPASYAFSDMIRQAVAGAIEISASVKVYRRYVGVEDLLAVSLASSNSVGTFLVDSGGPLVEMGELASAVASVVNPQARISRAALGDGPPDLYYSRNDSWEVACATIAFTEADLAAQITVARAGLQAMG